jgi:hypothetical protein
MVAGALLKLAPAFSRVAPRFAGMAGLGSRIMGAARPAANLVRANPMKSLGILGAGKGFLDEGFGGIIPGAIQGATIGGIGSMGTAGGVTRALASRGVAPKIAANIAKVGLPLAGGLGTLATTGTGFGGGAGGQPPGNVGGPLASAVGGGAGNIGAAGTGWVLQNTITGEQVPIDPQSALPAGMGQFGYTDPYGNIWNQINPQGPAQGRRTGKILDASTTAKEINILAPTIRKWAEQAKKDEMTRQLAAAGVRQNIATNARLNELSAAASQQAATTGLAQTGSALTQQYNYA